MKFGTSLAILALLALGNAAPRRASHQHVLGASPATADSAHIDAEREIMSALEQFADPVDAMLALDSAQEEVLAEARYLEVFDGPGGQGQLKWLTEGDKLRLRRANIDFIDWTGRTLVAPQHQAASSESC